MERKLVELRERLWLATVPLGGATDKYGLPWNDIFNELIDYVAEKDAEIARLKRELDRRPFLEPDEHIGKDSEVIAREAEIARLGAVVAEKDAEIARLEASRLDNSTWLLADKPRKVTDAQRERIATYLESRHGTVKNMAAGIVAILESTDEPAAK
jgi:hypothetical protein